MTLTPTYKYFIGDFIVITLVSSCGETKTFTHVSHLWELGAINPVNLHLGLQYAFEHASNDNPNEVIFSGDWDLIDTVIDDIVIGDFDCEKGLWSLCRGLNQHVDDILLELSVNPSLLKPGIRLEVGCGEWGESNEVNYDCLNSWFREEFSIVKRHSLVSPDDFSSDNFDQLHYDMGIWGSSRAGLQCGIALWNPLFLPETINRKSRFAQEMVSRMRALDLGDGYRSQRPDPDALIGAVVFDGVVNSFQCSPYATIEKDRLLFVAARDAMRYVLPRHRSRVDLDMCSHDDGFMNFVSTELAYYYRAVIRNTSYSGCLNALIDLCANTCAGALYAMASWTCPVTVDDYPALYELPFDMTTTPWFFDSLKRRALCFYEEDIGVESLEYRNTFQYLIDTCSSALSKYWHLEQNGAQSFDSDTVNSLYTAFAEVNDNLLVHVDLATSIAASEGTLIPEQIARVDVQQLDGLKRMYFNDLGLEPEA